MVVSSVLLTMQRNYFTENFYYKCFFFEIIIWAGVLFWGWLLNKILIYLTDIGWQFFIFLSIFMTVLFKNMCISYKLWQQECSYYFLLFFSVYKIQTDAYFVILHIVIYFFFLFLINLTSDLLILLIFLMNQVLVSVIFLYCLPISYLTDFNSFLLSSFYLIQT